MCEFVPGQTNLDLGNLFLIIICITPHTNQTFVCLRKPVLRPQRGMTNLHWTASKCPASKLIPRRVLPLPAGKGLEVPFPRAWAYPAWSSPLWSLLVDSFFQGPPSGTTLKWPGAAPHARLSCWGRRVGVEVRLREESHCKL